MKYVRIVCAIRGHEWYLSGQHSPPESQLRLPPVWVCNRCCSVVRRYHGPGVKYVPAERQVVDGVSRYVRLRDEPMGIGGVLPWLEANGFVRRLPDTSPESETGYRLQGWGSTYFAVPFEKSVAR